MKNKSVPFIQGGSRATDWAIRRFIPGVEHPATETNHTCQAAAGLLVTDLDVCRPVNAPGRESQVDVYRVTWFHSTAQAESTVAVCGGNSQACRHREGPGCQ